MSNNLGVVSQTVTDEVVESPAPVGLSHIDWGTAIPYLLLHLLCFSVFWVRVSPIAVGLFIFMLYLRVFALTAFYHLSLIHI